MSPHMRDELFTLFYNSVTEIKELLIARARARRRETSADCEDSDSSSSSSSNSDSDDEEERNELDMLLDMINQVNLSC